MNTILTDDERRLLSAAMTGKPEDIRAIEAAVLAKLREQEPPGLRQLLKEVVCLTYRPDLQVQASELLAAPLPAVVQVPQEFTATADNDFAYGYQDGWNACRKAMLAAAPEAPAQGDAVRRMMGRLAGLLDEDQFAEMERIATGAGVSPAQPPVPVPWREAVKVMREALASAKRWHQGDKWRDDCTAEQRAAWEEHASNLDAAIALADSLEGGE